MKECGEGDRSCRKAAHQMHEWHYFATPTRMNRSVKMKGSSWKRYTVVSFWLSLFPYFFWHACSWRIRRSLVYELRKSRFPSSRQENIQPTTGSTTRAFGWEYSITSYMFILIGTRGARSQNIRTGFADFITGICKKSIICTIRLDPTTAYLPCLMILLSICTLQTRTNEI